MARVQDVLGAVIGAVLYPFRTLPPAVGLGAISLLVAVGLLLVMRAASDQAALGLVKRRMHAALFEIRLFNDDIRAMYRALFELVRHNATYLRLSLGPMLWVFVPLVLLLTQLQAYFGHDGLSPGAHTIVAVRMKEAWHPSKPGDAPVLSLDASDGLRVETPFVWMPAQREAAWRLGAESPGNYVLTVTLDGRSVAKRVRVSNDVGWRVAETRERGFLNELLYPGEPPIADEVPIESIRVAYPERQVSLLGWHTGWMNVFFVLSLAFAVALKKRLGVVA